MPLVVVLHGCGMTPGETAASTGYSRLARQDGFMVLYPDVGAADASISGCWRGLWDPRTESRGRACSVVTYSDRSRRGPVRPCRRRLP